MLVEAQFNLSYETSIKELALWCDQNRSFARVYIATRDAGIPAGILRQLKRDGVGLLVFNGNPLEVQRARTYALQVPKVPAVPLGSLKAKISKLCVRFNEGDRKDALRDLFELVEGETGKLIRKASAKGWLSTPAAGIAAMDWSSQINSLASSAQYNAGFDVLFDSKMKDDMQSFRGARNLYDHPAKTAKAENKRDQQAHERMVQGPRILSDILTLARKVK